jgi:hypothetical protein
MIRLKQLLKEVTSIEYPTAYSNNIEIPGHSAYPVYYKYVDPNTKKTKPDSIITMNLYMVDINREGFTLNGIAVTDNEAKSGLRFRGLKEESNIRVFASQAKQRTMNAYNSGQKDVVWLETNGSYGKGDTWALKLDFEITNIGNFQKTLSSDAVWGSVKFNVSGITSSTRIHSGGGDKQFGFKGNPKRPIWSSEPLPTTRAGGTITPGSIKN